MSKKIVFLTGTRADFGKMKSLMLSCEKEESLEVFIFVTGMHLIAKYGNTSQEIVKEGFNNIFTYFNHDSMNKMDKMLAKTIEGFSDYIREISPDMIIVHGDRLEALAGATVGAFNNILVSHVEGGEISGTIDESIRHAISKLSHLHFVSNNEAKNRLLQMGENESSIFIIGSPDLDIILNNKFKVEDIKEYYNISFHEYAISIFHPVTTEYELIEEQSKQYFKALVDSNENYLIVYPNNDYGSEIILKNIHKYLKNNKFRIFPSLRFEYFSTLVKHAKFIIGNSSTGVREAPYYPTISINVGTRQNNRTNYPSIVNININYQDILDTIENIKSKEVTSCISNILYGDGNSSKQFLDIIKNKNIWDINTQKTFHRY